MPRQDKTLAPTVTMLIGESNVAHRSGDIFKKVLKYDGNVPHSVEAAGPGADGKAERYSAVMYRRGMALAASSLPVTQWQ